MTLVWSPIFKFGIVSSYDLLLEEVLNNAFWILLPS